MDYSAMAEEFFKKAESFRNIFKRPNMNPVLHGEMHILHYLWTEKRSVQPSELSGVTDTSTARIAMALGSLEKKGMIIREVDRADRRKVLVTITSAGEAMIERSHDQGRGAMIKLFEELGEEDTKEFMRIMSRVMEIMKSARESGKFDMEE